MRMKPRVPKMGGPPKPEGVGMPPGRGSPPKAMPRPNGGPQRGVPQTTRPGPSISPNQQRIIDQRANRESGRNLMMATNRDQATQSMLRGGSGGSLPNAAPQLRSGNTGSPPSSPLATQTAARATMGRPVGNSPFSGAPPPMMKKGGKVPMGKREASKKDLAQDKKFAAKRGKPLSK